MLVEKFVDSPRHIEIQVSLFHNNTLVINCVPNRLDTDPCVLAAMIHVVMFLPVIVLKNILLFYSYFVL